MEHRLGDTLRLAADGAERLAAALDVEALKDLDACLAGQAPDQAGIRLFGVEGLAEWLDAEGAIGRLAAARMVGRPRPVRAILFDKTAGTNWALAWHQDRVVAVRERIEVEGFGPWTRKHGALHVAPPFEVLGGMLTLRVHLDPAPLTNAPLLVAPGSHRFGRIAEADVPEIVARCGTVTLPGGGRRRLDLRDPYPSRLPPRRGSGSSACSAGGLCRG